MKKISSIARRAIKALPAKILLRMKLTSLLLLLGIIQVFATNSYSQSTKLTMDMRNASVVDVLRAIEDQSEFYFVYDKDAINLDRKVNVEAKNATINEILSNIFRNTDVNFKVINRHIILSTLQSTQSPVSKVSGKVTDSSGSPIPGVSVSIKGTTLGTITNGEGIYSLSNIQPNTILVFSFVGMKSQEVVYKNQSTIDVALKEESIGLEEVVAIGYGTQKKADLTGAVSSVKTESLQGVTQTLSHALQGQLSGVTVIQNSGAPGEGVQIRVRGAGSINDNSPLYIVDGMVGDISSLNPADIESISVLKDAASAAIYGSRGANGVVIVTTKKGSREGKTIFSYNTSQGIQVPWKMPKSLTAEERNTIHEEALTNDGTAETETVWDYYKNSDNAVTRTNWFNEIFRAGYVATHDLSIQGGSKRSNYMFSLGYLDDNGIIKVSDYKRYNIRINSQHEIVKNLTFGENISAVFSNTQSVEQGAYDGVLVGALFMMRNIPVWEDKENKVYGLPKGDYPNPVASLNNKDYNTKGYGLQGNGYLEYKFLNMFTLKSDYGYSLSLSKKKNFVAAATNGGRGLDVSSLYEYYSDGYTWVWNNTLSFDKTFGKHHVSALAGMSKEYDFSEWTSPGTAKGFSVTDDALRYYNNATTFSDHETGSASDYAMMSYFGRASYDFEGKYLLSANIRADGSSKFPEDNRWGTFPSVSGGWRISSEPFFSSISDKINELKLRASWGQLGNDKISNYYQYYATLSSVDSPTLDGSAYTAYAEDGMANKNIKWEVTTQTDLGLDIGLMKNKLNLSVDYFDKETSDILVQVPLVSSLGVGTAPYQNAGKVSNKGFDIDISYRNSIGKLKYEISGNISHVSNKLKTLGISGSTEMFSGNYKNANVGRIAEGEPVGHFYVLHALGLFQSEDEVNSYVNSSGTLIQPYAKPGDIKFEDRNGDGVIGSDDRFNAGDSFPKLTYSFNVNAEYKKFDFSMHWVGSHGNKIFNGLTLGEKLMVGTDYNNGTQILDRWTSTHTNTSIPRVSVKDKNNNSAYSTLYIEDGSFLRLKYVTVGYTFDKNLFNGTISKLRVYLTCQNLLTFTKYGGFDPEVGSYGSFNNNLYGIDKGIYPQAQSFVFGLNLDF
jgi:TonB-dependent starch-binding outer membrane protein SusC